MPFPRGLAPHPFDAIQNLGKREHADNDRNKIDAAVQGENIERKTRFGGKRGHAHTGEQQPEHAHGQPLELVVGRYAGNAGQAHQDQGARFKRPELQGENGDLRRGESKDHAREHASENRCLVHSAGITRPACSILDMPVEEWENVIKVNLTGAFFLAKACIPPMLEAGQGAMVLFSPGPANGLCRPRQHRRENQSALLRIQGGGHLARQVAGNGACPLRNPGKRRSPRPCARNHDPQGIMAGYR